MKHTYIGVAKEIVVIDFKRKLRSQHKITKCDDKSNKFTKIKCIGFLYYL